MFTSKHESQLAIEKEKSAKVRSLSMIKKKVDFFIFFTVSSFLFGLIIFTWARW